jgi:plastocyanin
MRCTRRSLLFLAAVWGCGGSDAGTTIPNTKTVKTITVTGAPASTSVGQSAQLAATAFDASGTPLASPGTFAWSSSSANVATVDQSGKAVALAAGTTSISASLSGVTGSTAFVVSASVSSVKDTIFTLPTVWSPAFLTISVGSSVAFSFGPGSPHNAIFSKFSVMGSPADIQNASNQTFVRTFLARGKFPFECTLHNGMVGEITVQ